MKYDPGDNDQSGDPESAGGGRRILGILELFVKHYAFQLVRQTADLSGIRGHLQTLKNLPEMGIRHIHSGFRLRVAFVRKHSGRGLSRHW